MSEEAIRDGYVRVSSIVSPFKDFSGIKPEVVANAANRGTRVHGYCELYAGGDFVPSIDEDCKPYFESFRAWFDNMVIKVVHTEQRLYDEKWKLTGQIDLIAYLRNDTIPTVIDFKTPQTACKTWNIQTAGYSYLCLRNDIQVNRRIALMLRRNGKPAKVMEYVDIQNELKLFRYATELYYCFNS